MGGPSSQGLHHARMATKLQQVAHLDSFSVSNHGENGADFLGMA